MNTSLHRANSDTVKVNNFSVENGDANDFASVSIEDDNGNSVALFFKNLAEVKDFALMIEQGIRKAND